MLNSDEGENDLFFDSTDCLSLEESIGTKQEKLKFDNLEYQIWLNEPQSVKERRKIFLREMGLAELANKNGDDKIIDLERISNCSGAISSSSALCAYMEEENLVCLDRETNSDADSMIAEREQDQFNKPNVACENDESSGSSHLRFECEDGDAEECKNFYDRKLKMKSWWNFFVQKRKHSEGTCISKESKLNPDANKTNRMKVKQTKKRCMEFTGVYMGQKIRAHKGFICAMKFSPDGQYLATGGKDGIVRIWHVTSVDASCKSFASDGNFLSKRKPNFSKKKMTHATIVIPQKIFQIEESPVHEFYGHARDVLDLAWSNSNYLLSSSKDKTVRLWQVGCNHCLNVFHHTSYVTCIQFNPIDENYFISGSVDGKVRIWGASESRVVDWVDVRDVISAICYQPDGNGFVVGSTAGTCRFYEASGNDLQLEAELHVQGRKKTYGNRITGIQFSQERSHRVMISSEDSKLRIFDGVDIVHKFKGLPKSGSQMSASFTSTGRHIISVGEDCRVYVWNYDGLCTPSSKHIKSVRSCEHFFTEGVSIAVPWSGMRTEMKGLDSGNIMRRRQTEEGTSRRRDLERFSIGNWFSMDVTCRGSSATWPEEKLPRWREAAIAENESQYQHYEDLQQQDQTALSSAWGIVIVAAGWDGTIRTFNNYGLPVRL